MATYVQAQGSDTWHWCRKLFALSAEDRQAACDASLKPPVQPVQG
jgi:hypothetical protein